MIDFIKTIPIKDIQERWPFHPSIYGLYDVDLADKQDLHFPLYDFSTLKTESPYMDKNTEAYKDYIYDAIQIANGNNFIKYILTHIMSVNLSKKIYFDLGFKPDISKYNKKYGTLTKTYWYDLYENSDKQFYSLFLTQWFIYNYKAYNNSIGIEKNSGLFFNEDKQNYELDDNKWFTNTWYAGLCWLIENGYLNNLHIYPSPCDSSKYLLYKTVDYCNEFYYATNNIIEFDLTNEEHLQKFISNIENYILNL